MRSNTLVYALDFLPTYVYREISELASRGKRIQVFLPSASDTADLWKNVISLNELPEGVSVSCCVPLFWLSIPVSRLLCSTLTKVLPTALRFPVRFLRNALVSTSEGSFRYFLIGAAIAARIREKPDLIHAHFAKDAAHIAMWVGKLLKVPFSVTTHAIDIFAPNSEDRVRKILTEADRIFTISHFNADYMSERYHPGIRNETAVTYLGLDADLLPQRSTAAADPLLVFCTASGLTEKKGVPVLIRACSILRERGINFRGVIAGSDPEEILLEEYRSLIESENLADSVEMPGLLPSQKLLDLMSTADIFVLPSVTAGNGDMDGIPVALMEAMAMGVPSVSSRLSGIPELIDDRQNGLLVEPGNAAALADAIEILVSDLMLAERLGKAGRRKVREKFSITGYVDQLLKGWSDIHTK